MEDTCRICGTSLPPKRDPRKIYCSRKCLERARGARHQALLDSVERSCVQCGRSLAGRRANIVYCSDACSHAYRLRQRRASLACDNCGGPLPLKRHRFCSDACKMAARRHETYGLTRAELATLLEQHSVCAICKTANWGRKGPAVDHDHATGAVRGVLCQHCNLALGNFRDSPTLLHAAISYLERP